MSIVADRPYLIISDTQIPYENEKALYFVSYLKKHYGVPDDQCIHVGDEVDQMHGGQYPKSPDVNHTANSEIKAARLALKEWVAVFPKMMVCISNHGMRWARKASAAEIPSQMLRAYQDVLEIPESWQYKEKWIINTRMPFQAIHGMELSGKTPYRQAAELFSISTVFGHLHSSAGICHVNTLEKNVWSMNTGSLIDIDAIAFAYGKYNRFKATNGAGLVFNNGTTPVFIPLT
jgi:hypothetical protein